MLEGHAVQVAAPLTALHEVCSVPIAHVLSHAMQLLVLALCLNIPAEQDWHVWVPAVVFSFPAAQGLQGAVPAAVLSAPIGQGLHVAIPVLGLQVVHSVPIPQFLSQLMQFIVPVDVVYFPREQV